MLCAVGDLVEDVVVELSGPPNRGSDVAARISRHRGGSAANVASAAAFISPAGTARFIGAVGDDPLGDQLVGSLEADGVNVRGPRGGRTGQIVVMVDPDDGERTFLTDRGVATDLDHIDPTWLDGVTYLHVPAYSLVTEPIATSAIALAALANERGIPVTVDAASCAVLMSFGIGKFLGLVASLNPAVLFSSIDEAAALGLPGDHPPARTGMSVVTRGRKPTQVMAADGMREFSVPPANVVDSTGAGDAFVAGFLYVLADGGNVEDAVRTGHVLAARAISSPGASVRGAS